ncbi:MAG: 30S ribosomal protein S2 [Candidatus Yanofskybacteria bacterium GW2011_GWF1_44_227]|uniref:Small ribosomal subunit protein uS2 n=1 Tax=Candidatus Yanofskybacteria bacterium GW2011_GWE2_40_11 TaxID=1619033 RepID=A0A0G0QJJ1_9BACT|nr:MAG: 30S ribosomal protein S2 [Candidatus Yanofskybacteria bacterium GW2011_GWE1_40_10]KKR40534.1 MAG: 30S ribosomal protein S2 [Candidatus Yanofskybacteria bacterium GW2011_GWE2_40_11]KKT15165.1 MAG: 30S ribosomal protein S2 [Candidatus Yanofskybacteria bacterium GW2011_GWF2_43_596]KKT52802.1 MAG: 30S ribosomal protein S2 [Candidatus Yanofskybacteria bacterium GW2011_GWF1_44_227]OGN35468.1 MAG: 30S ribosomal protein S2 [Candidatus Yanofskybacteria bacterium RIFOXYA1_FULL_44_17]OGN36826.1 M
MSENNITLSYEDMLKAGMHFGRKKTVFDPNMGRYVFTVRDGICIIDLLKTMNQLKFTTEYLKKVVKDGGMILFVAPTKQSTESVKDLAVSLGMPYVMDRWLGGTLTNFKIINSRVKRLEEMEKQVVSEMFEKLTKKERLLFNRELAKMKVKFEGLKKLTRMPDVVFVASLKESSLPIAEAKKMSVKIVGITNTDSDPDSVDYVIPANDRSKKSVDMIISAIKKELKNE